MTGKNLAVFGAGLTIVASSALSLMSRFWENRTTFQNGNIDGTGLLRLGRLGCFEYRLEI